MLVSKSDDTYRFCTDFRKINQVLRLIPWVDGIDKIGHTKYMSKFDLLKGCWQVHTSSLRLVSICYTRQTLSVPCHAVWHEEHSHDLPANDEQCNFVGWRAVIRTQMAWCSTVEGEKIT